MLPAALPEQPAATTSTTDGASSEDTTYPDPGGTARIPDTASEGKLSPDETPGELSFVTIFTLPGTLSPTSTCAQGRRDREGHIGRSLRQGQARTGSWNRCGNWLLDDQQSHTSRHHRATSTRCGRRVARSSLLLDLVRAGHAGTSLFRKALRHGRARSAPCARRPSGGSLAH